MVFELPCESADLFVILLDDLHHAVEEEEGVVQFVLEELAVVVEVVLTQVELAILQLFPILLDGLDLVVNQGEFVFFMDVRTALSVAEIVHQRG